MALAFVVAFRNSQHHRIIWDWRDFQMSCPTPLQRTGSSTAKSGAQSPIQADLECLKGYSNHYLSGQPMLVCHHPYCKILPWAQSKSPSLSLKPVPEYNITCNPLDFMLYQKRAQSSLLPVWETRTPHFHIILLFPEFQNTEIHKEYPFIHPLLHRIYIQPWRRHEAASVTNIMLHPVLQDPGMPQGKTGHLPVWVPMATYEEVVKVIYKSLVTKMGCICGFLYSIHTLRISGI